MQILSPSTFLGCAKLWHESVEFSSCQKEMLQAMKYLVYIAVYIYLLFIHASVVSPTFSPFNLVVYSAGILNLSHSAVTFLSQCIVTGRSSRT